MGTTNFNFTYSPKPNNLVANLNPVFDGNMDLIDAELQTILGIANGGQTSAQVKALLGYSAQSTLVLSAPGAATQTVTVTLKDANGVAIAAVQKIQAFMCTDSAGATPSVAGANTSVTATTGVILKAITAKLEFEIVTNASGVAVLVFNNTSGGGTYADRLALILPSGQLLVSAALAVAVA